MVGFRTKPRLRAIEAQICLTTGGRHFASKNANSPRARFARTRFLGTTASANAKGAPKGAPCIGGSGGIRTHGTVRYN